MAHPGNSKVLNSIPESPDGTDQAVLIVDSSRRNRTMSTDGVADHLGNEKSKEEVRIDDPTTVDGSLGSTQFREKPSLSNIYKRSGNVASSNSLTVDSHASEIAWDDNPTRKTGEVEIEVETDHIRDNSSSPQKHIIPEEEAERMMKGVCTLSAEEDDIFKDEDLPDKYMKHEVGICLLLEWIAFIVLASMLISSLTVIPLEHRMILGLEAWKWCLMVLVIFCGRLVSGWFISILVFLIERNFILRKRVLYFVYGFRMSVQNCIWLVLLNLAWNLLVDLQVEHSTKNHKVLAYVTRLLAAFFVAAVIWIFKILLVKLTASTFHLHTFFDRIQESIFNQYVLWTLSGPPGMENQESLRDDRKLHKSITVNDKMPIGGGQMRFRSIGVSKRKGGAGGKEEVPTYDIDVEKLHKLKQKNVSACNMKRLMKVIKHSRISTISNTIDESEHRHHTEITSKLQAKAAAKSIFKNVAKPGAKYIEEEDLLTFLKKSEVDSVFPQFEGAIYTGQIEKSSLKNWVVNVYQERKSLVHSLNDTKTAVKQLHKIVNAIVIVLIIIVLLLVVGIATIYDILRVSPYLALAGLIFGNTCKTVFEDILFVFVMHPFDVGDRCVVDGVEMIVEEINILTTVFLQDNDEKIYYPNSALATKPIRNFHRSPEMGDSVQFTVDVSTSKEKIRALEERIAKYLESKPQHWQPRHTLVVQDIQDMNTMKMTLYVRHTINHQNMSEKRSRRSDLLLEMKKIFKELEIK